MNLKKAAADKKERERALGDVGKCVPAGSIVRTDLEIWQELLVPVMVGNFHLSGVCGCEVWTCAHGAVLKGGGLSVTCMKGRGVRVTHSSGDSTAHLSSTERKGVNGTCRDGGATHTLGRRNRRRELRDEGRNAGRILTPPRVRLIPTLEFLSLDEVDKAQVLGSLNSTGRISWRLRLCLHCPFSHWARRLEGEPSRLQTYKILSQFSPRTFHCSESPRRVQFCPSFMPQFPLQPSAQSMMQASPWSVSR